MIERQKEIPLWENFIRVSEQRNVYTATQSVIARRNNDITICDKRSKIERDQIDNWQIF